MDKQRIRLSILKELNDKKEPNFTDYAISKEEFGEIVEDMQNNNLINGASFARAKGRISITWLDKAYVTMDGEYISQDDCWKGCGVKTDEERKQRFVEDERT